MTRATEHELEGLRIGLDHLDGVDVREREIAWLRAEIEIVDERRADLVRRLDALVSREVTDARVTEAPSAEAVEAAAVEGHGHDFGLVDIPELAYCLNGGCMALAGSPHLVALPCPASWEACDDADQFAAALQCETRFAAELAAADADPALDPNTDLSLPPDDDLPF
jgi:hypothetical protein